MCCAGGQKRSARLRTVLCHNNIHNFNGIGFKEAVYRRIVKEFPGQLLLSYCVALSSIVMFWCLKAFEVLNILDAAVVYNPRGRHGNGEFRALQPEL